MTILKYLKALFGCVIILIFVSCFAFVINSLNPHGIMKIFTVKNTVETFKKIDKSGVGKLEKEAAVKIDKAVVSVDKKTAEIKKKIAKKAEKIVKKIEIAAVTEKNKAVKEVQKTANSASGQIRTESNKLNKALLGEPDMPNVTAKPEEKSEFKKIDYVEAKKLFDEGKAVFVDARPEYKYIEAHIKGAISLSASRFEVQYEAQKDKLDKNAHYIIYCSSVECHLSEQTAKHLKEKGFINLIIFEAGWADWEQFKYPIEGIKVQN